MLTNRYLNLGYVSIIAIILGLVINTTFVNTAQAAEEKTVELKIKGMGCEMCAKAIETLVMECAGVTGCKVSYKEGKATVEIEAGKDKEDVLREIDEKMFFPYTLMPGEIEETY